MVKEGNFTSLQSICYCATAFVSPSGKKGFCNFVMQKEFRKSSSLFCLDALSRSKEKNIDVLTVSCKPEHQYLLSDKLKAMSQIQRRRLEIGDYLSWPVGNCYQIIAGQCKNLLCILLQVIQVDLHFH